MKLQPTGRGPVQLIPMLVTRSMAEAPVIAPGLPVTHDDIVNGNIPDSRGGTMVPADQIR
ncbi:hypothetical protein ACFUCT_03815 [Streptomyces parvus]|uniref:hypothetical protein n=1 Tax=Streptomyces parvus TaxID=66428 RepID=UPI00363CC72A